MKGRRREDNNLEPSIHSSAAAQPEIRLMVIIVVMVGQKGKPCNPILIQCCNESFPSVLTLVRVGELLFFFELFLLKVLFMLLL